MELKKNLSTYVAETKESMIFAIKRSGISRPEIADRMNEIIGLDQESDGPITTAQIDSWTKKDDRRTSFFKYLPIFCYVTSDYNPLQAFVSSVGLRLIAGKNINLYELGEAEMSRLQSIRKRRVALSRLGWVEDEEDKYE